MNVGDKDEYGTYRDLRDLEVGQEFHVINGGWDGEIVEVDGVKSVKVWLAPGSFIIRPLVNEYTLVYEVIDPEATTHHIEEDDNDIPY